MYITILFQADILTLLMIAPLLLPPFGELVEFGLEPVH